jgi:hypothetical protein
MDLLVQEISTEEPTNYEVSIQQGEPFGHLSIRTLVPLEFLRPQGLRK